MSEVPNKPGRGPAVCPKCKKGKIIAIFTGFSEGEAAVYTNGDTGPIENVGSSDLEISSLNCSGDDCGWSVGETELDPEAAVSKFLKNLEKKAK